MQDPFLRHKYIGLFLLFVTLFFFPTYLVWEIYFRQPQAVERLEEERVERGLRIFAQYCVLCHGDRGQGFIGLPLDTDPIRKTSEENLFKVISRGRGAMPAWLKEEGGALDAEEIRSLIAFLKEEPPRWHEVVAFVPTPTPFPPGFTPTPESPQLAGQRIFNNVCAVCHAFNGAGDIGPRLQDNTFVQSRSDEELIAFLHVGRPDSGMPAWEGRIPDEDLRKIIAFLRTLQPE